MSTLAARLDAALQVSAPGAILGVSIGSPVDRSTWRIDFVPSATADQRAAAQSALQSFDAAEPTPPLPALTQRQLRLMLPSVGISVGDIEQAISQLPEEDRYAANVEWQYAQQYKRDHPLVNILASMLGFPEGQLNALWSYAAEL